MRILIISRDPNLLSEKPTTDVLVRFREYSKYMEMRNITTGKGTKELEKGKIKIWGVPNFPPLYLMVSIIQGISILRKEKIDIITTQDSLLCGIIGYALNVLYPKTKLIVDVHGKLLDEYWKKRMGALTIISDYILKNTDAIRTVSKKIKKELEKKGFQRIYICPIGITTKGFGKNEKKKWGSKLIFVGRIVEEKNLELLLKAMEELKNIELMVLGDGPLLERMKKRAPKNVKFCGFVEHRELGKYYKQADVVVLPSKSESWGMAIAEGFAFGLPAIVSSSVSSVGELIIPGKNGFVFRNDDKEDLIEKIKTFFSLEKDRKNIMSEDAKKTAKKYSNERMAKKRYEIFLKVIESDKKR